MENGWIKSYRKFRQWEWYRKPGMFLLFHHLLYGANHKNGKWQGIEIERGQILSGRNKLSEETGLSPRQIRTCLLRLQNSGELTIKTTNKYSIITICNYDKYQVHENENDQQNANKRPASDQQATTNKNDKNVKNKQYDDLFELFWKNYPNKKAKQSAYRAWKKVKNPSMVIERMKVTLPKQRASDQWKKENGQFIPYPATYLNRGQWEDETI